MLCICVNIANWMVMEDGVRIFEAKYNLIVNCIVSIEFSLVTSM